MPRREDIHSILIIGAGPIILDRHVSLIIPGRKPVRH
ncbi:MAG: hypothetical protein CM15mP100_2240 [Alphaproteobacteria bacterium]|nr:MAG: hypothetical protein CM15mP100_2240 [Alphaproteobacteria bacterium]